MPRPKKLSDPTHCPRCAKPLPGAALQALFVFLRNVHAELSDKPPDGANADKQRQHYHLTLARAQASLSVLIDEEQNVCFGHEVIKRGPRKKVVDPTATPTAKERSKLRAVTPAP